MAKKRKTLPDNFREIINSGDFEEFKKVFDKCEITATERGATTSNALYFKGLTPEYIQFLIDKGLDINSDCGYGSSAVAHQAYSLENLKCLLENGADINLVLVSYRGNALYANSHRGDVEAIDNLLQCGADVNARGGLDSKTPLELLLVSCMNADIINVLAASKLMLKFGAEKTDACKEFVHKIGERFEFYRADFNKESVESFNEALMELYQVFDVEPVPQRIMYDGNSLIQVKSKTWQKQHNELWEMLVPGRGHASTVQGELIRIVGKILYEILDNGGMNWDTDYRKMAKSMEKYFGMADGLDYELVHEACQLAKKVSVDSDEEMLYRLNELTVMWVIANPQPIKLESVDYER